MMRKCSKAGCPAPKGLCLEHVSPDYPKCEHWLGAKEVTRIDKQKKSDKQAQALPWTGAPFHPEDIEIVSQRSSPLIIGMVGSPEAGKTSYLGMIYTLLFNGKKFNSWNFAGSYTLAGWETLAQYLKIKPSGAVEFAPATPSNPDFYSLLHLSLKSKDVFRDVLFADSSGEVFNLWSEDIHDPNAENARWIYKNSNAFIFMIDCVSLIEKKGAAKNEIVQIAEQIAANLNGRPVAVVWSKADEIEKIGKEIKLSLEEDLTEIFKKSEVFQVSNFPKSDPDKCHKNNIAIVDYLLALLNKPKEIALTPKSDVSSDLFFNYKKGA